MKPNFDVLHPALTCGQQFSSQQCSWCQRSWCQRTGVSVTLLSIVVLGGFPPNLVSSFPHLGTAATERRPLLQWSERS